MHFGNLFFLHLTTLGSEDLEALIPKARDPKSPPLRGRLIDEQPKAQPVPALGGSPRAPASQGFAQGLCCFCTAAQPLPPDTSDSNIVFHYHLVKNIFKLSL